ncbi:VOC family protein [Corynebacterium singulare]|uniref:VOC family protein n=1 Tax=Corynebacterium singulare TaxID=161899 RepID=UPI00119FC40C|nr:VOC family protein [Corynebacterium singulare]
MIRFDHLTILTTNFKESWDFYRTLPEAKVSSPNNEGYFEVSFHESVIGVFQLEQFAETTETCPVKSGGAIIQFLVEDVDEYWNKLPATHQQSGSSPRKMPWHSYSGYISDPDGNILEFYKW